MDIHAASMMEFLKILFERGVILPVFSLSLVDLVVGTNPTKEQRLSKLGNLVISPNSVNNIMDTINPIPGMLLKNFIFFAKGPDLLISLNCRSIFSNLSRSCSVVLMISDKTNPPQGVAVSTVFNHEVNLADQCWDAESSSVGIRIP